MTRLRDLQAVRERQKVLWVCAPLTLLFTLADMGALGRFSLPVFAVRCLWAGILALGAWLLPRVDEGQEQLLVLFIAVSSSAFFAWLVLLTGGIRSPMFHWILASPLTIAIVVQDHPRATLAAGVTTVLCGLGLLIHEQQPVPLVMPWAIQASGMSAVAVYASRAYKRMRAREHALQDARISDLERLRELDATQRARERAEAAVRARDEFLAVASHELRTPLTSLKLEVQNLVRPGEAATPARLMLISRQVDRLSTLLERLMDVSRVGTRGFALTPEEIDLGALIQDLLSRWEIQLRQAECPLRVEAEPRIIGRWDALRVGQILDNLISNAIKFGAGKPIAVRIGREQGTPFFSVQDHGIGVASEDRERIFERFERAVSDQHYGGLGLGLYVSKELVAAMGGTLELATAVGKGSTFKVLLPSQP